MNFDFPRIMVSLGLTTHPDEVLELLYKYNAIKPNDLDGSETCHSFDRGNSLGSGKRGDVFEIEDGNNKGIIVVIKEFEVKDYFKALDDTYIVSSALNEILLSSLVHQFLEGDRDYCICFPYFDGFFTCGSKGYIVMEQLYKTFAGFAKENKMTSEQFRSILFQVLYSALFMIDKEIMHNDLHAKNVMVRKTKGLSYRGVDLENVDNFSFRRGNKIYYLPNNGYIAKIVDYDFAAKLSDPKICPKKIYKRNPYDDWNLRFKYRTSYDIITYVAYMVYYLYDRRLASDDNEISEMKEILEDVAEYIVNQVEDQVDDIKIEEHYDHYFDSDSYMGRFMDLVSIPQYRPYPKYDDVDLSGILDISAFSRFRYNKNSSFMVGSI